jgi:hypothetical protein
MGIVLFVTCSDYNESIILNVYNCPVISPPDRPLPDFSTSVFANQQYHARGVDSSSARLGSNNVAIPRLFPRHLGFESTSGIAEVPGTLPPHRLVPNHPPSSSFVVLRGVL